MAVPHLFCCIDFFFLGGHTLPTTNSMTHPGSKSRATGSELKRPQVASSGFFQVLELPAEADNASPVALVRFALKLVSGIPNSMLGLPRPHVTSHKSCC